MNRRRYLRGVGCAGAVALAGCTGGGDGSYPSIAVDVVTESPTPDTRFEVEVTRQFDAERPAEIRARFTNAASGERRFWFGATPPISEITPEDVTLALVPDTPDYPDVVPETPGDCWRLPEPYGNTDVLNEVMLSAGESIATDYAVLSHPDADCLAGGRHRFSDSVRVTQDRRERLAFDLRVRHDD